jgi:hypothetical protein
MRKPGVCACVKPLLEVGQNTSFAHLYSTVTEEKEEARRLLSSYLKRILTSDAHHVRIAAMNRTQLARKLAKYYDIEFPAASEKTLTSYTPSFMDRIYPIIHVQRKTFQLTPPPHD